MNAVATHPAGQLPQPVVLATPAAGEEVQDFSVDYRPIRFKVNGPDVFEAHPLLPVPVLRGIARAHKNMQQLADDDKLDALLDMFDVLLRPESAKRFRQRAESIDEPVDLRRQIMPALQYLLERYGLRPTQAASSYVNGPGSTGTGSTAGAPPEASTPNSSAPTGS